jgi:DNA-binding NarL/FixJ family response regulator
MRISTFLVEDQPDIRHTLVDAMEEIAPIRFVGQADSETSARDWLSLNATGWDLAIIDLFLSEGTGFGVLKDMQMRAPRQKVVVLTSYGQERVLEHCRVLGADEVFDKAEDVEKLVAYCKHHAANLESMTATGMISHEGGGRMSVTGH